MVRLVRTKVFATSLGLVSSEGNQEASRQIGLGHGLAAVVTAWVLLFVAVFDTEISIIS